MSERDYFPNCTTTTPTVPTVDVDLLRAPPGALTSVELVWAAIEATP